MSGSEAPVRIGYVPEHFSTPLYFAQKYFDLSAELISFPSGTGHMITAIRAGEIDLAIGLTEGWVAGLGRDDLEGDGGYRIVGTYVETPLRWAISAGAKSKIVSIVDLKNKKMGVSRIGSGSFVMGYVLADQQGWLSDSSAPFEVVPLQTFDKLRQGVNNSTADFFMWEHFTSKKYFDNGEIKRVGEILTPWSSWKIVAATPLLAASVPGKNGQPAADQRLRNLPQKLNNGVKYFLEHQDEAVEYITTELDYTQEDARQWLNTVKFARSVGKSDQRVVEHTIEVLKKAGVIGDKGIRAEDMISRQWDGL